MGFRTGAYATVWSVEAGKGNFSKVRLSVSRKNQNTGEYEQEFGEFCMFIGAARAMAERLKERDRIVLGDVDVTTKYDKAKDTKYVDYKVFSFTMADDAANAQRNNPAPVVPKPDPSEGEVDEEELPF